MNKEVKVGLFAIISAAILYLGFNYLKGKNFFSSTNKYYTLYQNIDGLNVSNPVIINGYAVGRVSSIGILQERGNLVIVEMDVKENIVLNDSTTATLTNSDFLGSKAILLKIGNSSKILEDGDTLVSAIDRGLAALFENAQPITANLDVTIRRINEILLGLEGAGEEINIAIKTLTSTLKGVDILVRQNNVKLKRTFDGVNALLENINAKVDLLGPVLSNADSVMVKFKNLELEKTLASLDTTLTELNIVMTDINQGKGTIGKILKEDSLYNNLNQAIIDLDKLLIHFDENPKHFMGPLGKSKKKIDKERQKEQGK